MCDTTERQANNAILSNWTEGGNMGAHADVGIPAGQGRRMMTDLNVCGLFRIDKNIPLLFAPITLEDDLADGVDIFWPSAAAVQGDAAKPAVTRSQS